MSIKRGAKQITVEWLPFTDLSSTDGRGLVQQAIAVRRNAQLKVTNYMCGAALHSQTGQTAYYGCNVERNTLSETTHAEQAAVDAMVAGGHKKIKMIAIAIAPEGTEFDLSCQGIEPPKDIIGSMPPPCPRCLNIIWQNCDGDKDVIVLSVAPNGGIYRATIRDLLPIAFELPNT